MTFLCRMVKLRCQICLKLGSVSLSVEVHSDGHTFPRPKQNALRSGTMKGTVVVLTWVAVAHSR